VSDTKKLSEVMENNAGVIAEDFIDDVRTLEAERDALAGQLALAVAAAEKVREAALVELRDAIIDRDPHAYEVAWDACAALLGEEE
jgi:hypothetical protein